MKFLVLQHVPFEGPAAIQDWADANQHTVSRQDASANSDFPAATSFDCLIIMGGPMSVNDPLPWIKPELDFIRTVIERGKQVIGICLGAQLIAKALGADVMANKVREIGWLPVYRSADFATSPHWACGVLPEQFLPLHWHGDTFSLPSKAVCLLRSEGCQHQAFSVEQHVLGLQFHLEFDRATTSRVAEACADELADGGQYVQAAETIITASDNYAAANALLFKLLDELQKQV